MSHASRNLPPITTLQHPRIDGEGAASAATNAATGSGAQPLPLVLARAHSPPPPHPHTKQKSLSPQSLAHSHSENSLLDDQDRNPVHPNAKTTSTTNAANGSTTSKTNISSPVCRNCKTQNTPLWRRDESGQVLCNACGLFLKLHGRPRPISLKTDVIKSRNRIRHGPTSLKMQGGGSGSSSNPNTPELKLKEGGATSATSSATASASSASSKQPHKFSPKQYKPSKSSKNSPALMLLSDLSPSLVPLLPRGDQLLPQYWAPQPQPAPQHRLQQQPRHLVQPLHYPSSAPTHFAPNLAKITSPLLLATTSSTPKFVPSQSSERGSLNPKQKERDLAVVALENMSSTGDHEAKRVQLIKMELPGYKFPYSPSSALNGSPLMAAAGGSKLPSLVAAATAPLSSATGGSAQHVAQNPAQPAPDSQPAPNPQSLAPPNGHQQPQSPAHAARDDGSAAASPTFGPQFSLSHAPHHHSNLATSTTSTDTLPPLKPLLSNGNELPAANPQGFLHQNSVNSHASVPHQSLLNPITHYGGSPQVSAAANQPVSPQPLQNLPPIQLQLARSSSDETANVPGNAPAVAPASQDDVNVLKTRISELELVNDLYRTRIMELELMENAARQRENLLKKRLEELKMLPSMSEEDGQRKRQKVD